MRLLAIRLLAIFSSLGGPLYIYDLTKNGDKDHRAFAIAFAPIALMILGSLAFGDGRADRTARAAVRAGLFGAISLVLMNVFTTACLFLRARHPDQTLVIVGIAIGFVCSAVYTFVARAFLSGPRA